MKILLIKPAINCRWDLPQSIVMPPLGLLCLAAYIRKYRNDQIRILDLRLIKAGKTRKILEDHLLKFRPDITGISANTHEFSYLKQLAISVKKIVPESIVVAGGPHITAYPEETLKCDAIDYGIAGEGEAGFLHLLNRLEADADIGDVHSLVYKNCDGRVQVNSRAAPLDVNGLPLPAWDLINPGHYHRYHSMSMCGPRKFGVIFTSRGCPYRCIFCHDIFGKVFRARSVESILEEILLLKNRYGITDIEILDDCFNFDRERTIQFFRRVIELNLNMKFQFPNGIRSDILDKEIIGLMSEAGVNYACIAVESGSVKMQRFINKNLDLPRVLANIKYAQKCGIYTLGFFMVGFPGENLEQMKKTFEFARCSHLSQAIIFRVMPYRNTGLWPYAASEADISCQNRSIDSYNYYFSQINMSDVSDTAFMLHYTAAYFRFYSPWRVIRVLRQLPGLNDSLLAITAFYCRSFLHLLFRLYSLLLRIDLFFMTKSRDTNS